MWERVGYQFKIDGLFFLPSFPLLITTPSPPPTYLPSLSSFPLSSQSISNEEECLWCYFTEQYVVFPPTQKFDSTVDIAVPFFHFNMHLRLESCKKKKEESTKPAKFLVRLMMHRVSFLLAGSYLLFILSFFRLSSVFYVMAV